MLIDLFCGGGGFSLGAHLAGFKVATAFDLDPILTASFERNFPETKLVISDVAKLSADSVRSVTGKNIDGVFGGPPCQGFSSIGLRDAADPRRQLVGHFFRLVAELQPKFFVMENVSGLAHEGARGVLESALRLVADRYSILGPIVFNAADFGAATNRRRLFVIGIHKDNGDRMSESDLATFRRPPASVRDALSDLVDPCPLGEDDSGFDRWRITKKGPPHAYARRMRSHDGTFTGHRVVEHRTDVAARFALVPQGGMDSVGRHPRLAWSGLCPTLRAGTGSDHGSFQAVRPLHPSESRVITVREAARLQGFPDSHLFHPTTWHSFRMIGNSVSPVMSQAIFGALAVKMGYYQQNRIAA